MEIREKMNYFPVILANPLWESLSACVKIYQNEYNFSNPVESSGLKIHRVQPSEGYHIWHHEHSFSNPYRVFAWMIILEAPTLGGETEFLYQSIRIKPKVNQLSIWPAGFTHKHRGNPPLEGQKTYITGWFNLIPSSNKVDFFIGGAPEVVVPPIHKQK